MKKAVRSDWQALGMPEERSSFELNKRLTLDKLEALSTGLVPYQMEDKWFIYLQNEQLYFHRSWTGYCIYIAEVITNEDELIIGSVTVNNLPDQHKPNTEAYHRDLLHFLIDRLLLSRNVKFPSDSAALRHNIIGYGRSNTEE